ncbi:MAG: hypothetical protein OQL20_08965 [Sedimenticola sp.]|nr:hypothetical protein [Sedimenticola sp.]
MRVKIRTTLVAALVGLGLVGCSAHPGSGNWGLVEPTNGAVSKVIVHFDGRAELINAANGEASHHCFWGGKSGTEMRLDCTTPQDTETRLRFYLAVDNQDQAILIYDGRQVGRYKRLPQE